jgi:hypothetical protein
LYELRYLVDATNAELAAKLGWPVNRITPRILELRKMGLVLDAGHSRRLKRSNCSHKRPRRARRTSRNITKRYGELRDHKNTPSKDMFYKAYTELLENISKFILAPQQQREQLRSFLKKKFSIE